MSWQIEQVHADRRDEGLAMVVGTGHAGEDVGAGVKALRLYMAEEHRARCVLWWLLDGPRPLAAALVIGSPGRTSMILHSTTDGGIIPIKALSDLLATVANETLDGNVVLTQALLWPSCRGDVEAFASAGFMLLADLIYMRQCLRGHRRTSPGGSAEVEYRSYSAETHADFAAAILASYADSLDCPALAGLRSIEDVLAGHKAAGVFREDLWTVAYWQGRLAGVVLLNENVQQNAAEIVYMGAAKPFRGRGLGQILLSKAADLALANRFSAICLAVDSGNHYARRLYTRAGFVQSFQRLAYVRVKPSND